MQTFTIDQDNNISALAPDEDGTSEPKEGSRRFHSEQELAALAAELPGRRLVELWNSLPGIEPVKKFTNRKVAVSRIWKAIQSADTAGEKTSAATRQQSKLSSLKRGRKQAAESSGGTKAGQVIALLEQPSGASLKEVIEATGWQPHSVRSFISGHLRKKLGLRVKSFRRDGERVYAIRRKAQ